MQTVPSVKTISGPFVVTYSDGSKWTTERTITTTDRWCETPFGLVNFGVAMFSPDRFVEVK